MKTTIELKVGESKLEMGDARISLDLINPMFNELSDYSLPFPIPVTENNLNILGIDHDINAFVSSATIEDVTLKIGEILLSGILIIEGSGEENYLSSTFYSGRSRFFTEIKGKYLNELVYSETISAYPFDKIPLAEWLDAARDSAYLFYPDCNYVFAPVWMPNYGDDDLTGKVEPEIVNKWDMANNTFYFPFETGLRSSHFAPYFYLCFVIKKLFELYGYIISSNELEDSEELKKLVIFHTNNEYYSLENADFSRHLPHLLISDFITILEKKLNLRFIFSQHNDSVKIKFLETLLSLYPTIDITGKADPKSKITIDRYDGFEIPTNINTDTTDSSDKLSELDTLDNSVFDQIVENVSDLAAGAVGDLALIKNINEIYCWDWDGLYPVTFAWLALGTSFVTMKNAGTNVLNIDQDAKDLLMHNSFSDNVKYLPRCDNERHLRITMSLLPIRQEYEDLTLLFYRGMVPYQAVKAFADLPAGPSPGDTFYVYDDDETYIWDDIDWVNVTTIPKNGNLGTMTVNTYPLLTNSMYMRINRQYYPEEDYYGPFPDSTHSLSLFGDKGLYSHYFEKYIYWMMNIAKKEQRQLHIDDAFLSNFEWDVMLSIKNQNYFISRIPMDIDFTKQSVSFKECELYSL